MFDRTDLFLGGAWHDATGNAVLEVVSPSTEEVVGHVPLATEAEVDRAVAAARTAFDEGPWPRLSRAERSEHLRRLVTELDARREILTDLQVDEMGCTRSFALANAGAVSPFLEQVVRDAAGVPERELRDGAVGKVLVSRNPVGVTAAITPWNAPVMVALTKIIPSLLMGCPIVLKPAPESPLSSYPLAEAIVAAGIPAGVVSIVHGRVDVGAYLVSHPGVDIVTFTGSPVGGRAIAQACGALLRPVVLELGGKSASIVAEGVDMAPYLPALIDGSMRNSGQMCISANRVLVHESQRDDLVAQIVDFVSAKKVGDPHDSDTYFGPLASRKQREIVEGFIASGRDEGAKVVLGGGRPEGLDRGWFVEPTVFVNVDNSMRIAQEEIFGPVLSVIAYRDEDEAIAIANDSQYGLGGAVFAPTVEHGLAIAARVVTGTCSVNGGPPSGGGGPFGGVKASGLGRERSREGLEHFTELKSVSVPAGYALTLDGEVTA